MRHWSQLATRNWRAKRLRTAGAVLAIALGTGAVVWVTCCYESVRQTMLEWAGGYVGKSHISVQSPMGKYDTLNARIVKKIEGVEGVRSVAPLLIQRLPSDTEKHDELVDPARRWPTMADVDFHGIDLEREPLVRDWSKNLIAGRMLRSDDHHACVLEMSIAEEQGVGVGDRMLVWRDYSLVEPPVELEIVGLLERERLARFQKGVALLRLEALQEISRKHARVTSVDVVLDDPSMKNVRLVAGRIHASIRVMAPNVHIRSAEARMKRIKFAQDQQQIILILLSCMALLTALFIILSTLSMGMIERIAQLGLMRCVGLTRLQLAGLVLVEVFPMGLLGIALGVPIGLTLTKLSVWLVPEYVGHFTISWWGIGLAAGAGLATTLLAAALPAAASLTVSPLEATRPRARRAGLGLLLVTIVAGGLLLAAQFYIMSHRVQRDLNFVAWSATAVVLLYLIYACAAPLMVFIVSRLAVPLTGLVVAVRTRLLQDQVGHAVWRSAGICCGLMVGLSLIVGLFVFNASFRSGWQFPKQFPEAYIWSDDQIDGDVKSVLAEVPGVKSFTTANAPNVIVEERQVMLEGLLGAVSRLFGGAGTGDTDSKVRTLRSITWFLGIEPDTFFDQIKLEFVQGDQRTAIELLKRGGYVLIASDFARTRNKGVEEVRDKQGNVVINNKVRVNFNNRWAEFRVAGVIDSPALDIAASYFQVQSEAYMAAVGSVIGTNEDLKRLWRVDGTKLILVNFDLPPGPPPPGWPPPRGTPESYDLSHKHYEESIPLEQRWRNYRETRVLQDICRRLRATARYGTASELKSEIDAELTRMTYLLSAIPAVALLVAAIGVANLMTANVASRTKQLATLRAVGATRGLVLRMVMGEALILGLMGSALGLGLGMHLAWNVTTMTQRMWGLALPFAVPWNYVGAAIGLTVGLCVLAGLAPARHASRTNVIEALHVS